MLSVISFIFGLIIGSFLNVVIFRLPLGRSVVHPRSSCPTCHKLISWFDNIPLLSYILLGGKCRYCKQRIALRYPFVELLTGTASAVLFMKFGLTWSYFFHFLFLAALIAVIFIDLDHQIIPDVITYPGIIAGFASSFLRPDLTYKDSALGILIGGGVLYLVAMLYFAATRREGMGGGDIKLLAMIGAFLGWKSLPLTILSSSLLGSIVGIIAMVKSGSDTRMPIPFGPFLSIGAVLYLFWGQKIILWYTGLLFS